MTGGQISSGLMLAEFDSKFRMTGGAILPAIGIPQGSHVTIEGGSVRTSNEFALIRATRLSELTIVGRSFQLGGADVAGLLQPGDSLLITQRDGQTLDAVLRDGSPLKLFVGNATPGPQQPPRTYIDPLATLRLTLVPEPTSALGAWLAAAVVVRAGASRRGRACRCNAIRLD